MGAGGQRMLYEDLVKRIPQQEVEQPVVNESYSQPVQTKGNYQATPEELLSRYTETGSGLNATPQANNLANTIAEREKLLNELTVNETLNKTRPGGYQYTPLQINPYTQPGPSRVVGSMPTGLSQTTGDGRGTGIPSGVYVERGPGGGGTSLPQATGYYKPLPDVKYTESITRDATPDDSEYIKQQRIIDSLRQRQGINERTGINSLVNQPQTSYNINDIMKRYIG